MVVMTRSKIRLLRVMNEDISDARPISGAR